MPTRRMQVHKQRSGYKAVLPQPIDFSSHVDRQRKPLMHAAVKRCEFWEWSDHTHENLPPVDNHLLSAMPPAEHAFFRGIAYVT